MADLSNIKVALVHDWLVSCGGGERVLCDLHAMFPDAPIYTLVYDEERAPEWCRGCDIRTTYIQRWPGAKGHHKLLLSFMPKAWEALDFSGYDLVISTCSSCCKGIITGPDVLHVCYCFSPTRYLWDLYCNYLDNASAFKRIFMKKVIHKVRMWDYLAAQRPDVLVADSDFVGRRIAKFYGREASTVYPGTILNEGAIPDEPGDYYLIVSRFVGYKRVDLAIEACNRLGRRLIVVGSGGEEEGRLRQMAGSTVEFKGALSDEEMQYLYLRARAFLFPGLEDYGITPVEAMSAGCPVIAYGRGGALETVIDGQTGLYFHEQTAEALASCIERYEREGVSLTREQIRGHAFAFSQGAFRENIAALIDRGFSDKGIRI